MSVLATADRHLRRKLRLQDSLLNNIKLILYYIVQTSAVFGADVCADFTLCKSRFRLIHFRLLKIKTFCTLEK